MAADFFLIFPFFSLVFFYRPAIFILSILAALLVLGAFSPYPAGVGELIFLSALLVARVLINFFDVLSLISRIFTYMSIIFVYLLLIIVSEVYFFGWQDYNLFIRGGLFFIRMALVGIFLWFGMIGMQYAISFIRYAFLEEKII